MILKTNAGFATTAETGLGALSTPPAVEQTIRFPDEESAPA